MIASLCISNSSRTPCVWWPQVDAFKTANRFDFAEGLTILWGPNGCGKSTLLRVLARLTHCEQGGIPKVTHDSLLDMKDADGVDISTDGKPVHFYDPSARPGLIGGMAGFDYDFLDESMYSMKLDKVSSGQGSTAGFNRIIRAAAESKTVQSMVKDADSILVRGLQPTPGLTPGRPTLLLDEPDRSLSIPRAAELWHVLASQKRFQVIVATHSVSALGLAAKYIDVVPGYLAECSDEVRTVAVRLDRVS
jgi:energy-coupling factor transporter ATP-binding protein EcfA2